ncbi:MAG: hypothetical protein HGB11_15595 [Chlorobiales bacterium]|nr:hypothetical protein [Chlorobiales bacterium]
MQVHFDGEQEVIGLSLNGFPYSIAQTTSATSLSISPILISRAMFAADIETPNSVLLQSETNPKSCLPEAKDAIVPQFSRTSRMRSRAARFPPHLQRTPKTAKSKTRRGLVRIEISGEDERSCS